MRSPAMAAPALTPPCLARRDWAQQLQQTLDEEKQADQKLNQLAERINVEAKAA